MKIELNFKYRRGFSEVDLFQEMANILKTKYKLSFVRETHRHLVEFDSITISKKVQREISDLWIITYSPIRKSAKMTFLQAKFHRKALKSPFEFSGEFFQYELLSKRPNIVNIGRRYDLPNDVLSFAKNDSIGTYGVFYFDTARKIDMAYSTAALLNPKRIATENRNTNVKLVFSNIDYSFCILNILDETQFELASTLNIDCFVNGLLNFMIGAEIQSNMNMLSTVKSIIEKLPQDDGTMGFIEFIDSLGINYNSKKSDTTEGICGNILFINVDK